MFVSTAQARPRAGHVAMACLLLGLVALPALAQQGEVEGKLENGERKTKFTITGKAPSLPSGAFLHITLSVQGIVPAIEAAFFRVTVDNGTFSGNQEWRRRTFPPMGYTTTVQLHMDAQPPEIRAYLTQQFGYTSDHIQLIATSNTQVGTPEEQVSHRKATLVQIRELCDQTAVLHRRLVPHTEKAAAQEAQLGDFATAFAADLVTLHGTYDELYRARIVWGEASFWEQLGTAIRELARIQEAHGAGGEPVATALQNLGSRLTRLRSDIESRLPTDMQRPRPE